MGRMRRLLEGQKGLDWQRRKSESRSSSVRLYSELHRADRIDLVRPRTLAASVKHGISPYERSFDCLRSFPYHHWIAHCSLSFTLVKLEHFFHGSSLPRNTRKHRQTLSVAASRLLYPYYLAFTPSYSLMRPLTMFFSSFTRHCRSA